MKSRGSLKFCIENFEYAGKRALSSLLAFKRPQEWLSFKETDELQEHPNYPPLAIIDRVLSSIELLLISREPPRGRISFDLQSTGLLWRTLTGLLHQSFSRCSAPVTPLSNDLSPSHSFWMFFFSHTSFGRSPSVAFPSDDLL